MKGLTDRQKEVLMFISDFLHRENMSPTIQDISEGLKISSATVFAHVRTLQRKGYVSRTSKARSLVVAKAKNNAIIDTTLRVPVLGTISAGVPILAEEHVEKIINLDARTLPPSVQSERLFALHVIGESMRDLGIYDGDLIVAKATNAATIGDIVIALVDNEVTVKSLYLGHDAWELRPANPDFKSKFVPLNELNIQGVVVALQRVY